MELVTCPVRLRTGLGGEKVGVGCGGRIVKLKSPQIGVGFPYHNSKGTLTGF